MAPSNYIGQRLSYDGNLCTVRYVGEVRGTKGGWLGVEWDDPTRGKHSGEHGGVNYFECLRKECAPGSFVRPNRPVDPPRDFVEALRQKYASEVNGHVRDLVGAAVTAPRQQEEQSIRISGKEVEEVGFDKIREQLANLHELRIVILDGLCVARPLSRKTSPAVEGSEDALDTADDIRTTCPKIAELDLSRNLFEEWREVVSICRQLNNLSSLKVDGNRFRDPTLSPEENARYDHLARRIQTLSLDDTLMSWQDISGLTSAFSNLTSLTASRNGLVCLRGDSLPTTLSSLTLEDNDFKALGDLRPLTALASLQKLLLKNNAISKINEASTNEDASLPVFPSTLAYVDLSHNIIDTWSFIDQLHDVFPGMTSLRVSHNPLYQNLRSADDKPLSVDDGYMLTLARLSRLKTLNYSPITPKERLNAETYYLSQIAKELSLSSEDKTLEILSRHRRYAELCAEYGEPTIQRTTAQSIDPNSLAARLMKLNFLLHGTAAAKAASAASSSFSIEVPKRFTAYTVLGLVGKQLGLPPIKLRLVWETGEWDPPAKDQLAVDELWDSDDEIEDEIVRGKRERKGVPREVEIVGGTRSISTWVDGSEADIRVEMK
ncbi:hypothetical protein W97_06670 [Coniosporium apollinis CBS 100218]|uniref:CAP-Gly domain-containing protein n=1 Tax=Coniosporium apollinis (strain CBS 100218) TaxID=1168221 RepID=R7YZT4_CONA1|nr:uncharacterized protein W97_06670 [Coniosporium apollinis CBS 100218]EON67417.1 hypothetical protein W97_06670 [Coniosporium apollinis CBS 100218]